MEWSQYIKNLLHTSGLFEQVKDLVKENKDEIDDIEEYIAGIITKMLCGDDKAAFKDFKQLKKPVDKLKAARYFIGRAREERKKYETFQEAVVKVAGGLLGTALKYLI